MKTILIIEDDEETLELLGIIAGNAHYKAVLRSTVLSILEIEQISPDLVILDHWINGKLGGDLCLQIKQNPATSKIPVVLLSALSGIGQIALHSTADGSINKPFDIEEVEAVFHTYLG
jgi:DNA-binding response OmpR family regulator